MEITITIKFKCKQEHVSHWEKVLELLANDKRGWQLQDAIDPISESAADKLDDVWDALPYGNEAFEVVFFDVKDTDCHLELLTGSPVVEAMEKHFIPWLAECGVSNLRYSLAGDEDG